MVYGLPSCNQTWRAGKWTIEINVFPSLKPPFSSGIFQPAMFNYRRVRTMAYGTYKLYFIEQITILRVPVTSQ